MEKNSQMVHQKPITKNKSLVALKKDLKPFFDGIDFEKSKYAIAFCLSNQLNPAKNQVSFIPNKKGVINAVVDYQWQINECNKLGYKFKYNYYPDKIEPKVVECVVMKGYLQIGEYPAWIKEWQGQIGKPIMITRIRATTQAMKEYIPEMRTMMNNFEVGEVLANQNKEIDIQESVKEIKKLQDAKPTKQNGQEVSNEEITAMLEASDIED